MKKNFIKILVVAGLVLTTQVAFSQATVSNMLGSADQTLNSNWATFKNVLTTIALFLMGGGIVFALYCYVYDQSRMKVATISIIAGALLLTIGGAMNLLN